MGAELGVGQPAALVLDGSVVPHEPGREASPDEQLTVCGATQRVCTVEQVAPGKDSLREIVSMLVGLIKSNSAYRLHEGEE